VNMKLLRYLERIKPPNRSVGPCRNSRECRHYVAVLGNGYCVECWDNDLGSAPEDYKWTAATVQE
jgi:hypothetical protein